MARLGQLLASLKLRGSRGRGAGGHREAEYTTPQIGGRNWRRARNEFARAMRDVSSSLRQVRHASHVRTAQDHAADASVALTAAIAAFNELVAIGEANE